MRNLRSMIPLMVALCLVLGACGTGEQTATPDTLKLLTHDSFADGVDDTTFAQFTETTGIEVEVIPAGDAGSMVNQAALTTENPLADVMFGVDDTFLSRALDEGVFLSYVSPGLDDVKADLRPSDDRVTPIDYGDVCFNYDKAWFQGSGVAVPETLDELTAAPYPGLVTVEHPATSSPGLAFLLATIDLYGEEGWLDWWEAMREGGVTVVPDWDTAYYADFTRYGGASPIVMSYASSPPAEVIFSDEPLEEAPTGVIEAGCYRQVEYAGVLAGTEYPDSAGDLIDYMLSTGFQEGIPLTWFVYPANAQASLPEEFVDYTTDPADPSRLDPDYIAANRDDWIDQWIAVMEP